MKPLFEPPPGAVPMAAKCEAYLTIHHPDNEQTTADGVQSNTHNPLAFVYLRGMRRVRRRGLRRMLRRGRRGLRKTNWSGG